MNTLMPATKHPTFKCFEARLNSGEFEMMFGDIHYGFKTVYDTIKLHELNSKEKIKMPAPPRNPFRVM